MSKNRTSNDFHSLLSVFRDATSSSTSPQPRSSLSTGKKTSLSPSNDCGPSSVAPGGDGPSPSSSLAPPLLKSTQLSSSPEEGAKSNESSYCASTLKERAERLLRVHQIRRSASSTKNSPADAASGSSSQQTHVKLAVCATIVDEFPHEAIWRKWMEDTGGEFMVEASELGRNGQKKDPNPNQNQDLIGNGTTQNHSKIKNSESNNDAPPSRKVALSASAELYVHAKNPERVATSWLRSKTLPHSHRPNWNDVRIIRAMLSLTEAALKDEYTTHILFCTESCIPIATLKETARSILLDDVCFWNEEREAADGRCAENKENKNDRMELHHGQRWIDWDRSYVDCYGRSSQRCTRFDEHNCWNILMNSIPGEAIHKALPGWCLLSRKHAHNILHLPSQLGGMDVWPAFERVWAPEEVYFPTALALCGHLDEFSFLESSGNDGSNGGRRQQNEEIVVRRAVTHSQWDERAVNLQDRAHPLCYDGFFDEELVRQIRQDGCLFLRKMKRSLDKHLWERIVVHRQKGGSLLDRGRRRDWGEERGRREENRRGREWDRQGVDEPRRARSYTPRRDYDSSRSYRDGEENWSRKRNREERRSYDDSYRRKRQYRR